jgi:hypothetical protein
MKTIIATQKPPFNDWIQFVYKEVRKGTNSQEKTPKILDFKAGNNTNNK